MKIQEIYDLAKRYDKSIEKMEDKSIALLSSAYEDAYKQLIVKVKALLYDNGLNINLLNRELIIAEQLKEILDIFKAENTELDDLVAIASKLGAEYSSAALNVPFNPVPVEAVAVQARETRRHLLKYGEDYASEVTTTIGASMMQGWGTRRTTKILQERLGILKSRAEMLARTESIKAYSYSSQQRFIDAEVYEVLWLTVKEGVCKFCNWRNGKIFKIGSFIHPPHPRCRCTLVPIVGEDDYTFLKDYKRYEGDNPGVTSFEKTAGFTKIGAIADMMQA